MQHRIQPFAFGAREGDLVLRLSVLMHEEPGACVDELRSIYARASISEVWADAAMLAGPHGRALALALRGRWNVVAVGAVTSKLWPTTPGRIVLDVSSLLSEPIGDLPRWQEEVSKLSGRLPQVDEIFAVGPVAGAMTAQTLTTLDTLLAPAEGCTLYLTGDAEQAAAIDACSRHGRPWAIRRAGQLQLSERVPAESPAG